MDWDWRKLPGVWDQLINEAWDAPTLQKQRQLAQKALSKNADCIDGYVILAAHATHLQEAYDWYLKGTEVGERKFANELSNAVGHFWGIVETRPYMRAHLGVAMTAWQLGRRDEAIRRLWRHLQLNPNDNQGARQVLLGYLQAQNDDTGLNRLCQMFPRMAEIRNVPQTPIILDRSLQWVVNRRRLMEALHAVGVTGLQDLADMSLEKLRAIKGIGAKTAPRLQASAHAFLQRKPYWFASLPASIRAPVIVLDVRVYPDLQPQRPFGFGMCDAEGHETYLFVAPDRPAGESVQIEDDTVICYPHHEQIWTYILEQQQATDASLLCYGKQVRKHLKATAPAAVVDQLNVIDLHREMQDTVALPIEATGLQDVSEYVGWDLWSEENKPYITHLHYLRWLEHGGRSDLRTAVEGIRHNIEAIRHVHQWAVTAERTSDALAQQHLHGGRLSRYTTRGADE